MGRPSYSPEQRRAASDASFSNSLVSVGEAGCQIIKRDHMVGYDGKRIRTRTFAWDYWNPEEPLKLTDRVQKTCTTKFCVAKAHMIKIAVLQTDPAKTSQKFLDAAPPGGIVLTDDQMLDYLKKAATRALRTGMHIDAVEAVEKLKAFLRDNFPVSIEGDEWQARWQMIRQYETAGSELTDQECDALASEWGITE